MHFTRKIFSVIVFFLQLPIFSYMALNRFATGDEGFYLAATKLILKGEHPYIDFFYTQMPLLPYFYALFGSIFGITWESMRMVSVALTSLLGTLLFERSRNIAGIFWATIALFLFVTCNFVFPWYITAKTPALSVLLAFVSYMALMQNPHTITSILLSGFFLGLATNTRLYFCLLIPVFLIYLYILSKNKHPLKALSLFVLGIGIALLPNLYFILKAPESFWFSNIGYHLIRTDMSGMDAISQKMVIAKTVLGLRNTVKFCGIQLPLLLYSVPLIVLWSALAGYRIDLAIWIAVIFFFVNLIPTPSYVQYYAVIPPFIIVGIVTFISQVQNNIRGYRIKVLVLYSILALCCALYVKDMSRDINKFTRSGRGVLGVKGPSDAPNKTLKALDEVSRAIDYLALPNEPVLALWPGYLIESKADFYKGFENHFGLRVGDKISPDKREIYHIRSRGELFNIISKGKARIVALRANGINHTMLSSLQKGGYIRVKTVRNVAIFRKNLTKPLKGD